MTKFEQIAPMTYTYGEYILQRQRDGMWVAFDAADNEVYVRTSRRALVDMIDRETS